MHAWRSWRLGAILAVSFATGFGLVGVWSANADYWYGLEQCDAGTGVATLPCAADNRFHTYCHGGDFDGENWREAARHGMHNLEAQTAFTSNRLDNCGSDTDVIWVKFNSAGDRGAYQCTSTSGVSGPGCQSARLKLNPDLLNDDLNRKKTACHEVGHSGGLSHSSDTNDCMVTGPYSGRTDYNVHHIGHLNDN